MSPSDMAAQMRAIAADLEDYVQRTKETLDYEDVEMFNADIDSLWTMANELVADA